ncbi:hypothetical protein ASG73_12285 [Janibacter sp. Soil728]|uniref:hypothetical protein n=1 Tax=Janibacter sp. Soil728 TaxID=1736393 RepID=UPI0006F9B93D|nr:hypothetical protein [Janibacter sp. Soil728]KRE37074.1 hypothetical protein ASG73_12285 [Janibacter sp. Soil728]
MSLTDLTLVTPLNELLTLTGLPRVGLEQLAVAQLALVGGDRALAALPMRRRRRRRGGGIGFLGLCCCLLPLAVVGLIVYLLWARQKGKDPRAALGDIRSNVMGNSSQPTQQAPPPPGTGHQAPQPPSSHGETPPPPASDRTAPPPPPGEGPVDPPPPSGPDRL